MKCDVPPARFASASFRADLRAAGDGDVAAANPQRMLFQLDKVSVRLVTNGSADLVLTDAFAHVNTAMGWRR